MPADVDWSSWSAVLRDYCRSHLFRLPRVPSTTNDVRATSPTSLKPSPFLYDFRSFSVVRLPYDLVWNCTRQPIYVYGIHLSTRRRCRNQRLTSCWNLFYDGRTGAAWRYRDAMVGLGFGSDWKTGRRRRTVATASVSSGADAIVPRTDVGSTDSGTSPWPVHGLLPRTASSLTSSTFTSNLPRQRILN